MRNAFSNTRRRRFMSPTGHKATVPSGTLLLLFYGLLALGSLFPRTPHHPVTFWGAAPALADSALCNSEADTTFSFGGSSLNPDTLRVAIVWVAFSDSSDTVYSNCSKSHTVLGDELPTWFRELETEFEDYMDWQSYGKLALDAVTVQRSGADSLKAWNLGKTPCYWITSYLDPQIGCPNTTAYGAEGCVNRNVVDLIEGEKNEGYFSQFDAVCFIHRATAFSGDQYAGFGGSGGIRYGNCSGCGYQGPGTTQRPIQGNSAGDKGSTAWLLGHEFGHTIGLGHTPGSGQDTTSTVFMGRYDAMQNGAPQPITFTESFAPYHVWQLTAYAGFSAPQWFETAWFDTVSVNTLDVRVYDVRNSSSRNIVRVDTRIDTYNSEFWLVNHQDSSFDEMFGGKLLAIWHMRNPEREGGLRTDFDLELATGKYEHCGSTVPDAVAGKDSLECKLHKGRVFDLWADAGPDTLGPRSNPNSNDYSSSAYPGTQSVETEISIHDIRLAPDQEPQEDYLVDVIYETSEESPFLYVWQGRDFPRLVNVLVGLGQPAESQGPYRVGADHLVLFQPLTFDGDRYVFKLREDGGSTTYVDRAALRVVDHDADVTMAVTNDGELVGYSDEVAPSQVAGLPGNPLAALSQRGNPVHGEAGSALILDWDNLTTPQGLGGLILSSSGRQQDNMPQEGTLVVDAPDGQGGWSEVARIVPRSTLTDVFLPEDDLGRLGPSLSVRIRWLDFHAVDYVAFVSRADASAWSAAVVAPDSAEIAYGGSRLPELTDLDGSFAVLGPGAKLTVAFPFSPPEPERVRSIVFAVDGYYVLPAEHESSTAGGNQSIIDYVDRNRPNPFNPTTHIVFGLNRGYRVSLDIYSAQGRLVRKLYDGPLESGPHEFVWDGRTSSGEAVVSGVYFYRLRAGSEVATGKMLTLK